MKERNSELNWSKFNQVNQVNQVLINEVNEELKGEATEMNRPVRKSNKNNQMSA